jgi:hypothetical protein
LRDSLSAAISMLKHVLLQQIFGSSVSSYSLALYSDVSFSHASYLNTMKDIIKIRKNKIVHIVILYDFFMFNVLLINYWTYFHFPSANSLGKKY